MLEIVVNLPTAIQHYVETTPPDRIFATALFAIGWFPIAAVLVWGLLQVWLDHRQGLYAASLRWHLLRVQVPQEAIQTPKGMENFFTNIAGSKSSITWKEKWMDGKFQPWFSFEIVSIGGDIRLYIRTIEKYRDIVESALYAQYPEAQILEVEDYIDAFPDEYPNDEWDLWGSEMKLSKADVLPIRTWEEFEHQGEKDQRFKDPLLPILEGLGKMQPVENYAIQILVMQPNEQDWVKEGVKMINKAFGKEEKKKSGSLIDSAAWIPGEMVNQISGGSLFGAAGAEKSADPDAFAAFRITPQEREQLDGVAKKITKIGWYTKIRIIYVAKKEVYRKGTIASLTKGFFHQYGSLALNKFGLHDPATPKDDYFWQTWEMPAKQTRLAKRYKKRSFEGATAYILNNEELATIFHFPAADARTPVLTTLGSRRSEAPLELQYATDDTPDLPNIDRVATDVAGKTAPKEPPKPLATPRPMSPTATTREFANMQPAPTPFGSAAPQPDAPVAPTEVFNLPQPGMPAPLPPGLDISDEPIDPQETPSNLPM